MPLTRARVWALPLSLAATRGVSLDFLSSGYLDVSVPRVASSHPIWFGCGRRGMTPAGFPHSGTCGSMGVCPSPQIIAACRALLRLPVPRHPPCALCIFSSQRRPRAGAGPFLVSIGIAYLKLSLLAIARAFSGPLVMMPSMSRAMQMSRCPGQAPERRPGALGAGCCGLSSWTGPRRPFSSRSRELRSTASGHESVSLERR